MPTSLSNMWPGVARCMLDTTGCATEKNISRSAASACREATPSRSTMAVASPGVANAAGAANFTTAFRLAGPAEHEYIT
eukprot:11221408-Lingulodinium_polyedra.AAC.1